MDILNILLLLYKVLIHDDHLTIQQGKIRLLYHTCIHHGVPTHYEVITCDDESIKVSHVTWLW